jgi:hypothetical protein
MYINNVHFQLKWVRHSKSSEFMKRLVGLSSIVFLITVVFAACETVTGPDPEPAILNGTVVSQINNTPLQGASVRVITPLPNQQAITGADGSYSLSIDADSLIDVSLQVVLDGYITQNYDLFAAPGRIITVPAIRLIPLNDTDPDPNDPTEDVQSGTPSSIALASISSAEIVVINTGGVQQTAISFVVTDSVGVPLSLSRQTSVNFRLGASPNGGESLNPSTTVTNENGIATTVLESGTTSGVVQVIAEVTKANGTLVQSIPIRIVIRSGPPSADHFSVATSMFNLPGYHTYGLNTAITAFIGDRYGNKVDAGMAVYYTTDGGIIQGASFTGTGSALGQAVSNLTTAAPFPVHPTLGPGFATIRVRTVDYNNQNIESSVLVLFSGNSVITTETTSIDIPHQGSQTVHFRVTDQFGNPLAAENTITVDVEGDNMKVIGDTNVTLPDTQSPGLGITDFSFTISDDDRDEEVAEVARVTITVEGPNRGAKMVIEGVTRKVAD